MNENINLLPINPSYFWKSISCRMEFVKTVDRIFDGKNITYDIINILKNDDSVTSNQCMPRDEQFNWVAHTKPTYKRERENDETLQIKTS